MNRMFKQDEKWQLNRLIHSQGNKGWVDFTTRGQSWDAWTKNIGVTVQPCTTQLMIW